jgi:hypothetical protein
MNQMIDSMVRQGVKPHKEMQRNARLQHRVLAKDGDDRMRKQQAYTRHD